ncbi:hypothetical protein [Pelagibaculum spongiae]|uniref:Uncharacterized protein n=1 Tax=Pelagibaculum spongiae TaxID=2080658 RepID=A0A2V1GR77_9GAMM|nr:hypothetical protein [Pelagibaculum spongiae]PVZ66732.1 hypothetical protein DC094_15810 [Pelagibaculum spongiae]
MKKFIITSAAALVLSASFTATAVTAPLKTVTLTGSYGQNIEVELNQALHLAPTQGEFINYVSREAFRTCNPDLLAADATNRFSNANLTGTTASINQNGRASQYATLQMSTNGELFIPFTFDLIEPDDVGIPNPVIPYQEDGKTFVIAHDRNNGESAAQACIRGKKFTISQPNNSEAELQQTIAELQELKNQNARLIEWFFLAQSELIFQPNATSQPKLHRYSVDSLDRAGILRIKNPDGSAGNFHSVTSSNENYVYWNTFNELGLPTINIGYMEWIGSPNTYGYLNYIGNAPRPGQALVIQTR